MMEKEYKIDNYPKLKINKAICPNHKNHIHQIY